MAKCIMVQGTMSGAGKSLLVTALCRIYKQDGWRVAPFKSQNMALNSCVTRDGLEMGRAQAVQAEAAGLEADVRMNPILLKPTSDMGSQLIVNGEVRGTYQASEYFSMKRELIPEILSAYHSLAAENDIIVIEGAGSPAEINLKENDIVNMGLAAMVDAPVLLVGDIDRGGVFAQLYGTIALLEPEERARIVGTVINKFRGDASLLKPGVDQLEMLTGVPNLGVIPYTEAQIDDEDSLSPRFTVRQEGRMLDIAVIRLPRISNFTDFAPLDKHPGIRVRYVKNIPELGGPDLIVLPGTKSTMSDLVWLRESGLEAAILRKARDGTPVLGICGGYQMLGLSLEDPYGVEMGGQMRGIGLLPVHTVFSPLKERRRVEAYARAPFKSARMEGYEIHMGHTDNGNVAPFCQIKDGSRDGAVKGAVFGTYLHGLFDTGELTIQLAEWLAGRRGLSLPKARVGSYKAFKQEQYNLIADIIRRNLDMNALHHAMRVAQVTTGGMA